MTLNQIARNYRDEIRGGIPWLVVYKYGRSWYCNYYYPESGSYEEGYIFDPDDLQELQEISTIDPKAICFNGYYMGFGNDFTVEEIENKIRFFYNERYNQPQGDFLDCLVIQQNEKIGGCRQ